MCVQWIPMWFSLLPVTTDDMESKNTYDNLCHFIETYVKFLELRRLA